jgi:hypothetical protein
MQIRHPWTYPIPVAATLWCVLLAPVQSLIWNGEKTPSWIANLTPLHEAAHALYSAASLAGDQPYDFFGRLFLPIYAGVFFGFASARLSALGRSARIARAVALLALTSGFVGDIIAYWLAGRGNDALRAVGFWQIEVPALTVAIVAAAVLGVAVWRSGAKPAGAILAATPVLAVGATAALQYMPHGPMLALAIAATAAAVRVDTMETSR